MGKSRLKFSEDHYKELLEQASDLIQSVDNNGKFVYVNRAWKEKLGYTNKEVDSISLWDIIHPESLAHCQEIFQKVINGEKIDLVEAVFITKKAGL